MENTGVIITSLLGTGLLVSALIKNYHFEIFHSIINNKKLSKSFLIRRIWGGKHMGPVWILPYRIDKSAPNDESALHKEKFNAWSKIFISFWCVTIIWVVMVLIVQNW